MLNFKYIRATLVASVFTALTLSSGASPQLMKGGLEELSVVNADASESFSKSSQPIDRTSTFYSARRDVRRCASPLCGGYFVRRVNTASTRCADGRFRRECYVAEIVWPSQLMMDSDFKLVRGTIVARRYEGFGSFGELRVTDSWTSLGRNPPVGTFYLVRDRGVRCIAAPCPTHQEMKLNSSFSRNIAGVNLEGVTLYPNSMATITAAMTGPHGLIVAGHDVPMTGPGGKLFELRATQVYVGGGGETSSKKPAGDSMKPCVRGGCSNQVCADHPVITTCEWRPEYECYQKATCERQADGNCGFTKTRELTECLARR